MKHYLTFSAALLLAACGSDDNDEPTVPEPVVITTEFNDGKQGWEAGFSDYPVDDEEIYELEAEIADLPDESGDQGFRLKGMNRSDDLFMYLKGRVVGLHPNTDYTLHGSVSFFSNAGADCIGIGGAPGESVYVKMGATEIEPEQLDFYMNIDKGNQSQPGNDAIVIGNIVAEGANCEGTAFGEKTLEVALEDGFEVQSSASGELWIMIGTDSGYEGLTDMYYTEVHLTLTP
ncbi:hypothetical protein [Planctobacterium marinum]|uniref:hypothetical protein n=1 Tax=Planctobacterium marinum TaxID=1631968 RepID=UPI001E2FAE58|nr:hypothetical protein [Planctobacterium marinum]MCC2606846.1 hypothetical protein [Planctobacterium marinum]